MGVFAREENGIIYLIDEVTGNCVAKSSDPKQFTVIQGNGYDIKRYTDGREVVVARGDDEFKELEARSYPYSEVIADIICQKIAEGGKITEICGVPPIPPYDIVRRWMHRNTEFKVNYKAAKEARAESMHDRALTVAEKSDKETSTSDKLYIDALKWSASKSSPDEFGDRTKVVGDKNAPVSFIIDTGIRKEDDPLYNKDEAMEREVSGSSETTVHHIEPPADTGSGGDTTESNDD